MRAIRKLGYLLVLVLACAACEEFGSTPSFLEVKKDRSRLFANLESYQSISEVRSALIPLAEHWEIVEDSGKDHDSSRPPFAIFTATIHGYKTGGDAGDLKVTFFNNRLMSTWFYPDNPERFADDLDRSLPSLKEHGSASIFPFTVVTSARDYKGKSYFSWEDSRLASEVATWIRRYS